MSWVSNYAKSSVGAKHIMAITGLALVLFVLVHMVGNLLIYVGRDALNTYAATLKGNPLLLWGARLGLLTMVAIHIGAALRLTMMNRAARPQKYVRFKPIRSPFYSRVMPLSGLILLAFIVYHLLHFTVGSVLPDHYAATEIVDGVERHDVYTMVVQGFQIPIVAISYIVAMVLLCMHLAHGVTSFFQSLGLEHPKYNRIFKYSGPAFATLIFIGNCSMPIAVLAGAITLPGA